MPAKTVNTSSRKTEQKSGLSTASLVLAIVWLLLCLTIIWAFIWIPAAIVGLIFGIIALVKKQKKWMAIAWVIISWLVILITAWLVIFWTIFVKKNSDVLLDPMMQFAETMKQDPELEELMQNPAFQSEFQYLFEQRMREKYGDLEEIDGREEGKQYIPEIFEEMESIMLWLKEKYQTE